MHLPGDIWLYICQFVQWYDHLSLGGASKYLHRLCRSKVAWDKCICVGNRSTDAHLRQLVRYLPKRWSKSLSIQDATSFTDDGLCHLNGLQHMVTLDIGGCTSITSDGVRNILVHLPCLQALFLDNLIHIGVDVLHHRKSVRFICVLGCHVLSRELEECLQRQLLDDARLPVRAHSLLLLTTQRGLLHISRSGRISRDPGPSQETHRLRDYHLARYCSDALFSAKNIFDVDLRKSDSGLLPRLTEHPVMRLRLGPTLRAPGSLGQFRQLRLLDMTGIRMTAETVGCVAQCASLRALHAGRCGLRNRDLLTLSRGLPRLRTLDIRDSPHVTDAGMLALEPLQLFHLCLDGCSLTLLGIWHLREQPLDILSIEDWPMPNCREDAETLLKATSHIRVLNSPLDALCVENDAPPYRSLDR